LIATPLIYKSIFKKRAAFDAAINPGLVDYSAVSSSYPRSVFSFTSSGEKLTGYSYDNPLSSKLVIVLPGIGSTADEYLFMDLAFYDAGYDVVSFDGYGLGASGGDYLKGMPEEAIDLESLLTYLASDQVFSKENIYLFGHSQGAYAACLALNHDYPQVKACVAVSGFNSSEETVLSFARRYVNFLADLSAPFVTSYQRQLFGDYSTLTAIGGINHTAIPFLICQGETDQMIKPDVEAIYHYKDQITNNSVSYYVGTGLQGSHDGILFSLEACSYQKEVSTEYEELKKQNNGSLTYEQKKDFMSKVDDAKYSQVNQELIEKAVKLF
jgi:pimeloyl-ACP methyl ester carboxylesterase